MAITEHYVTVNGAGNNSGSSWTNAMAMADFITDFEGSAASGDYYYVEEGTYTMGEDVFGNGDASAAEPVRIVGVKSGTSNEPPTSSDWATGANRPVFAMGVYYFYTRNYHQVFNIDFTGTDTFIFRQELASMAYNCKVDNSGVATRDAFNTTDPGSTYIACEGISDNGYAFGTAADYGHRFLFCYAHDSAYGYQLDNYSVMFGCIADACTTYGIEVGAEVGPAAVNCSIYGCGTGIYGTTGGGCTFINNAIDACTTGANWTTNTASNFWGYNCWDNTSDVSDATTMQLIGDVTADPGFNDPSGSPADFTIADGDNADDVGLDVGDLTGAVV